MVEFALVVAVIFFPLLFGFIELGRTVLAKTTITAAAREGVRYAVVRGFNSGSPADSAQVANYIKGRTKLSPIGVKPTWSDAGKARGTSVTVQVTYRYAPIVPVLPARTIQSSSRQLIWY